MAIKDGDIVHLSFHYKKQFAVEGQCSYRQADTRWASKQKTGDRAHDVEHTGTYPFLVNTEDLPRFNHLGIAKPRPPAKSSPRHSAPTALASPGRTDGSSTAATPVASHVGEASRVMPPRFLQGHSNSPVIHPLSWQSAASAQDRPTPRRMRRANISQSSKKRVRIRRGGRRAGRCLSGRTPTGHRRRGDFPSLDIGCAWNLPDVAIGPACRAGTNHAARRRHCEAIGKRADTAFRLCT